jgi:hypothetical protein
MKCIHLTIILILAAFTPATAQIIGTIQDQTTGAPIEFADVILINNETEAFVSHIRSDENGRFRLSDINIGEFSLTIRLIGYDVFTTESIVITSATDICDLGVIQLQPLEFGLSEVVVEASRRQIIYRLDRRIIDASSNLLGGGGTAVDILESTPSIRVGIDGEVTFRGSSGFLVYINGRPSFHSGTLALQQIPASQIENIEIITTPSARHSTDGEAGIINIITRTDTQQGISGMVNLHGSTALSNGGDFHISQQRSRLRWNIAGYWNQPIRESDFHQYKQTIVGGLTTTSVSDGPRRGKNYHYGIRAGIDFALTPRTSLNAEYSITYNRVTRRGDLDYSETIIGENGLTTNDFISVDRYSLSNTINAGTVGFLHRFNDNGHQLSGSFMAGYQDDALEYFQSDLFNLNNQREHGHRAWESEIRWTVQSNIDYVFPFSSTGRIEAGWQYFSYLEDGDYRMQWWNPETQEFFYRDDIFNTFYFRRGIHSIFLIGAESFNNLDIQAGVRGEHTHRVLRSSVEGADRTVNRFELFPSIHLGYNLSQNQRISFGYSYRTNRPQLFFMEPYITYRDYFTAEIGNPDIRPEYIHSFDLSYRKLLNQQVLQAGLFYRARTDKIERLRVPYRAGVTLDSMANVGNDHSLGVELSAQLTLNRWWNMNLSGTVYYYHVINHIESGGREATSTNYDFTINNQFRIRRNTRIQLDGYFVGPTVTTQGRNESFWFANLAVRQQFTPNFQSTLSFRNIFNSARHKSTISTPDLTSITVIHPVYPVIQLSVSYTFNNFRRSDQQARDARDLFEGTNF